MGTMLTWSEMMTKATVNRLHSEVQRRLLALIYYAYTVNVPLGVGTGWRVQPDPPPPGFALPGNSWHESCPVKPTSSSALAIDTVPNISWNWMEAWCGHFGFRTFRFIGNEPWHIQPIEIPASRRFATTLPPLYRWEFPDLPAWPTPPSPPSPSGVFSVEGYRKTVKQGSTGKMAKMCQQQMNLIAGQGVVEDGNFGSQSVAALKNIQAVLGVPADGICGQQTWQAMENGIKSQAEAGDWD
jgi:peptidoglycan hydrolase-like protein with peptidoglycan-binding domain